MPPGHAQARWQAKQRTRRGISGCTDAAIASAPWYGPGHGKDGVASFLEAIGTTGPVTEFTPLAYAGNDQGDVMVFIRYAFTVTATGLTFGNQSDWSRNVRAAAGCTVRLGGRTYRATSPELVTWADDKALIASAFNPVLRAGFRILGIRQIMRPHAELTD